jgi:hypothetical protein
MPNAVCVIVKNECKYILEWIAHHLVIGFDAVIVLDNESTDKTAEILQSAASRAGQAVRYIFWPNRGITTQNDGYATVCNIYQDEFDWIGFFDIDEFLVPEQNLSVADWLKRDWPASAPDAAAIGVNWLFFGSGGHVVNPGGLVLEAFQRRGAVNFTVDDAGHCPNLGIKSIVRPKLVRGCRNPHAFHVEGIYVDPEGRPITVDAEGARTLSRPSGVKWRLHHYFVRSRAQWDEKLARGYWDSTYRNMTSFFQHDRNEIVDSAGTATLPRIREAIHQMMPHAGDYYDQEIPLDSAAGPALPPPPADAGDDLSLARHWRRFVTGAEALPIVPPPPGLPNVALGKPARQSSISQWSLHPDVELDAAGAVSGRTTGAFQFHTSLEDAPWWRVDLGAPHEIVDIRIFNRGGDAVWGARLGRFRVECSLDGAAWDTLHTHDGSFVVGADRHPMVLRPAGAAVGRFVRIAALQRTHLHLDQVEVYGKAVDGAEAQPAPPPAPTPAPIAAPAPAPTPAPAGLPAALDELIALLASKTAPPAADPPRGTP